jgi:hypothetical protein
VLQEPHGVTSQKTEFLIVTAVETANLIQYEVISGLHVLSTEKNGEEYSRHA